MRTIKEEEDISRYTTLALSEDPGHKQKSDASIGPDRTSPGKIATPSERGNTSVSRQFHARTPLFSPTLYGTVKINQRNLNQKLKAVKYYMTTRLHEPSNVFIYPAVI